MLRFPFILMLNTSGHSSSCREPLSERERDGEGQAGGSWHRALETGETLRDQQMSHQQL